MLNKTTVLKKAAFIILCVILLVLLDQQTKLLAVEHLKNKEPFVIFTNILELLYVENRGAAFGIMNGMRWFFLLIAPLIAVLAFFFSLQLPAGKKYLPLDTCCCGVIAGAFGNFIDRLQHSYVVDFIYFKPIDFPVFNVADIYVTCSCVLLILLMFFFYSEEDLDSLPFFGSKNKKEKE